MGGKSSSWPLFGRNFLLLSSLPKRKEERRGEGRKGRYPNQLIRLPNPKPGGAFGVGMRIPSSPSSSSLPSQAANWPKLPKRPQDPSSKQIHCWLNCPSGEDVETVVKKGEVGFQESKSLEMVFLKQFGFFLSFVYGFCLTYLFMRKATFLGLHCLEVNAKLFTVSLSST